MAPMIPPRRSPRYRQVPSTRLVRTKRRCNAAWRLWRYRRDLSPPGERALWIGLKDGVCYGCFDLEEVTFCGTCGRGDTERR